MSRYYLVPFEDDEVSKQNSGLDHCPKYIDEIGKGRGVTDWNRFQRRYYIVIIDDDKQDMSKLESHSDVKKLTSTILKKNLLTSLNIDTETLSANPTQDEIESTLVGWLTTQSRTLRSL